MFLKLCVSAKKIFCVLVLILAECSDKNSKSFKKFVLFAYLLFIMIESIVFLRGDVAKITTWFRDTVLESFERGNSVLEHK